MWVEDYCSNCDKQCAQGAMYCSDECRMAEGGTTTIPGATQSHPTSGARLSTPEQNKSSRFLYDSPLIKPAHADTNTPPVSPLLIAAAEEQSDSFFNQTSTSYKKWLLTTH